MMIPIEDMPISDLVPELIQLRKDWYKNRSVHARPYYSLFDYQDRCRKCEARLWRMCAENNIKLDIYTGVIGVGVFSIGTEIAKVCSDFLREEKLIPLYKNWNSFARVPGYNPLNLRKCPPTMLDLMCVHTNQANMLLKLFWTCDVVSDYIKVAVACEWVRTVYYSLSKESQRLLKCLEMWSKGILKKSEITGFENYWAHPQEKEADYAVSMIALEFGIGPKRVDIRHPHPSIFLVNNDPDTYSRLIFITIKFLKELRS